MLDTGQIGRRVDYSGDYNLPQSEYRWGGYISLGVEMLDPDEVQDTGDVPLVEATIRLPISTEIAPRDRVRVSYRHGERLDVAEEYEVIGPPQRGPTGLVVGCRIVAGTL